MRVKLRCPNCEQLLLVREEELGQTGRCPTCKQPVPLKPPEPKKPVSPTAGPTPTARPTPQAPRGAPSATGGPEVEAAILLEPIEDANAVPVAEVVAEAVLADAIPMQPAQGDDQVALAVEVMDDDDARQDLGVHGTIAVVRSGPAPLGKSRSPGLALLLGIVPPFYHVYWYITARREIRAHREAGPTGSAVWRVVRCVLLCLPPGWFIYGFYVVPNQIRGMQSTCGDPNRINTVACLFLTLVPVLGWALVLLMMQKALTGHWQWHERRGNVSVTAGLAA